MSLSKSRSSAGFICRSCRALPSKLNLTPQTLRIHSQYFSTTTSKPISYSPTNQASKVNPFARARNNARAQDPSTLRLPLRRSGFHLGCIPDLKYWQKCVTNGVVADKSITAEELHQTATTYAHLALQGEHGEAARDPNLTEHFGIRLIALYYVHLCLMTNNRQSSEELRNFVLHIIGTLITVHEYQPSILSAARQRSFKTGKLLTQDILRRRLKDGGDGSGFVDANAATLAGLQCLWEVEELRGDVAGDGRGNVVEPVHAVHPSKMNSAKTKARGIQLSPTALASISRKKQEGLQWFRRAIELNTRQSPGTWNWEVSCYKGMVDLYDDNSPKERLLKRAALEHLAVQLDNMDGCFLYGLTLPKGSELQEAMFNKAAASGHAGALKEMERICQDKLMEKDEKGLTKEDIKHLVIIADEWGKMSQDTWDPIRGW